MVNNNNPLFDSVTIFILASNETVLLRETIKTIYSSIDISDLKKLVVVLKSDTCPSYYEINNIINESSFTKIEAYVQKAPNAVLCIAEIPPMATSSHFIIMAADSEMNPENVSNLIAEAKKYPEAIICAAKWLKESSVYGYGKIHKLCSRSLNTFIALLFKPTAKEPLSLFQIYPTKIYHKIKFSSPEKFLFERTLKPLRVGVEYKEIPTVYKKRTEGKSSFSIFTLVGIAIQFCITAIIIRFTSKRSINEK